jgi:hypothetical protein
VPAVSVLVGILEGHAAPVVVTDVRIAVRIDGDRGEPSRLKAGISAV